MQYTTFSTGMFKCEEETILILVYKRNFSTDPHLQEVMFDTFLKKII